MFKMTRMSVVVWSPIAASVEGIASQQADYQLICGIL